MVRRSGKFLNFKDLKILTIDVSLGGDGSKVVAVLYSFV